MPEKITRTKWITDEEFGGHVEQSQRPVLVFFFAAWCGPCLTIAPIIEELAGQYQERFDTTGIDVDSCPNSASHCDGRIPNVKLFRDGSATCIGIGQREKPQIEHAILTAL